MLKYSNFILSIINSNGYNINNRISLYKNLPFCKTAIITKERRFPFCGKWKFAGYLRWTGCLFFFVKSKRQTWRETNTDWDKNCHFFPKKDL